MKRINRLLAIFLVTFVLIGMNGFAFATEARGLGSEETGTPANGEQAGSIRLKIQAAAGSGDSAGQLADGDYMFTVTGPQTAEKDDRVTKKVTISVENGLPASAKVDEQPAAFDAGQYVEVTGLAAGEYVIVETDQVYSAYLVRAEGGKSVSDKKVVTAAAEAGKTGAGAVKTAAVCMIYDFTVTEAEAEVLWQTSVAERAEQERKDAENENPDRENNENEDPVNENSENEEPAGENSENVNPDNENGEKRAEGENTDPYAASGSLVITGTKTLTGREFEEGDIFTFTVSSLDPEAPLPDPASVSISPAEGYTAQIVFAQIDYSAEDAGKTYLYDVTESGSVEGVSNDSGTHTVEVSVADNGDSTLAVTPVYSDGTELSFVNVFGERYGAIGGITLKARKQLLGAKTLEAGRFSFELKDENGVVLDTKSNAADGSVVFDEIVYTLDDIYEKDAETGTYAGTGKKAHQYTISEVIPQGAKKEKDGTYTYQGFVYDNTYYTVQVDLTDNGDGTITAEISGANETVQPDYVFTNAYKSAGTLNLTARKVFDGGTLKGGDFTFELKDENGKVLQSKKNDVEGNISFDMITYDAEDVLDSPFIYTVSEAEGSREDVVYDDTLYTVQVTLKDNGDGTLKVTKVIDNGGTPEFVNRKSDPKATIRLGGVKVLKGKELKDGMFTFVLTDGEGRRISTATNDADGNFTFDEITYRLEDLGDEWSDVYEYRIYEEKGSRRGIIYDKKVYTVFVTVTDNGDGTMDAEADLAREDVRFLNTKTDSTGDDAPLGLLFGGLAAGAAGLGALLWLRRKK